MSVSGISIPAAHASARRSHPIALRADRLLTIRAETRVEMR